MVVELDDALNPLDKHLRYLLMHLLYFAFRVFFMEMQDLM